MTIDFISRRHRHNCDDGYIYNYNIYIVDTIAEYEYIMNPNLDTLIRTYVW